MSADALSQEEIDALLKGTAGRSEKSESDSGAEPPTLSAAQREGLSRYGDQMATTMADLMGTFLAAKADVKRGDPSPQTDKSAAGQMSGDVILALFSHGSGLRGDSALVFRRSDACKIGGAMVGDPEAAEFTDMISDAFKEVIHTIVGNLNTSLGRPVGAAVTTTPVELEPIHAAPEALAAAVGGGRKMAFIPYEVVVGEIVSGPCWQVCSLEMVDSLEVLASPPKNQDVGSRSGAASVPRAAPVEFDNLTDESMSVAAPGNLDLIMDISLEVRVQLGKSHLKIRDVLKLGTGSVVELDKLAGEPVDLLVNDVIFAKGEVVVIDENFGVRITEILSLQERIKSLGERKP